MLAYLGIVNYVVRCGVRKKNRTGIDTIVVPNMHFNHDMSEGFPALTTKKLAFKTLSVELEGFIGGITSKKWYQERGCKIWDEWANPEAVNEVVRGDWNVISNGVDYPFPDRKKIQARLNDLGPIYGYQWRRFNVPYDSDEYILHSGQPECPVNEKLEPHGAPYDQLATIVKTLKENPNDRRMVCSAWNPNQLSQMALPPCHFVWELTHVDGTLNLHWTQRSCDLMLGVPFNIASYALLLELLAKEAGMKPGNLSGMLCDCHIYENQIEGAKLQLKREPLKLPTLKISNFTNIFEWTHEDVELIDYNNLGKIDFGGVAV